eukprot:4719042-Amphidinium_carterae.5
MEIKTTYKQKNREAIADKQSYKQHLSRLLSDNGRHRRERGIRFAHDHRHLRSGIEETRIYTTLATQAHRLYDVDDCGSTPLEVVLALPRQLEY